MHSTDTFHHTVIIRAESPIHTGGGRKDTSVAFGCERRGFESLHRRLTFPLGNHLLAMAPFLKYDVRCYFTNKGSEQVKGKRFIQVHLYRLCYYLLER